MHFDANFKLILDKRNSRAEGNKSLWEGEGYFVETDQYRQYLAAADPPRREVGHLNHCRRMQILTPIGGV